MQFALTTAMGLLLVDQTAAFAPFTPISTTKHKNDRSSVRFMDMDMDMPPPAATQQVEVPVIKQSSYGPSDVRYSDFLKLVNADKIKKVTFSADGTQLLGVDVEGVRLKIESLPSDPALLTELTEHQVRKTCDESTRFVHIQTDEML
jgi:hypothetical protein